MEKGIPKNCIWTDKNPGSPQSGTSRIVTNRHDKSLENWIIVEPNTKVLHKSLKEQVQGSSNSRVQTFQPELTLEALPIEGKLELLIGT